jgi:hypothetical protein
MKAVDWFFTILIAVGLLLTAYFWGYSNGVRDTKARTDTVTVVNTVEAKPLHDTLWLAAKPVPLPKPVESSSDTVHDTTSSVTALPVIMDKPTFDSLKTVIYNLGYPADAESPVVLINDSVKARVSFIAHMGYYPETRKFRFNATEAKIEYPYTTITLSPLSSPDARLWQKASGIVGLGGMGYSIAKQSWIGAGVSALLIGVGAIF